MSMISVKNIDSKIKIKASFVLKTQGKTISSAVRETLENYALQYDEFKKNNNSEK